MLFRKSCTLSLFVFTVGVGILTAALPLSLHAESPELVVELEVVGLRRTREATVQRIIDLELPATVAEVNVDRIRERLLRSGLFVNEMEVAIVPTGADNFKLRIELEERWTLLPLPIAGYSDSGWIAGLAVIESNLLGTGTFLLSVATLRGDGAAVDSWGGTLGVSGGALQRGRVEPSVFFSGGVGEEEFVYSEGTAYRRFRQTRLSGRLGLGYELNDTYELSSSGEFSWYDVDKNYSDSLRAPDSTLYYIHGFSIEAESRRFTSFFLAGPSANVRYRHGFPLNGEDHFDAASIRLEYAAAPFGRHKLLFAADGKIGNEPPTELSNLGGTGYRTLPSRGSAAPRAAAAALEYEFPVLSRSWGTFTLLGFGEGGSYKPDGEWQEFYGPGAGFRLYLARVAIPALGFNFAYNMVEGEFVGSVALGMAF
ncbi:MAG: hypothetical protein EA428_03510 [Spirochaetaceae bacterium]|nr:MAG: hypothetical protein EA428_03510 [Spirochaetaceae bacterium]